MAKVKIFCIFFQKYLVISKKSSTFAPAFVRTASMRAIPQEVKLVLPTEKRSTERSVIELHGGESRRF